MNMNTWLLLLLVIASYFNLYLTFKRRSSKRTRKTELPISAKEWDLYKSELDSFKINEDKIKSWTKNRERLDQ